MEKNEYMCELEIPKIKVTTNTDFSFKLEIISSYTNDFILLKFKKEE